jgi:hypothetical protein
VVFVFHVALLRDGIGQVKKNDGTQDAVPNLPTTANTPNERTKSGKRRSYARKKPAEDKKKSFRRSWRSTSPVKKLEIIVIALGTTVGAGYLGVQIWGNLQTKWNFTTEHRPLVFVTAPVSLMVVRLAPDPDKRVFTIGFFPLKNSGGSPALHFIGAGEIIPGNGTDLQKKAADWFTAIGLPLKKKYRTSDGMWIMENGIGQMESTLVPGENKPFSIAQHKDASETANFPAVAVMRVQYEDASGNVYWTDACYLLPSTPTPGGPSFPCADNNGPH